MASSTLRERSDAPPALDPSGPSSSLAPNALRGRIEAMPTLDGWRAVAIGLVVALHCAESARRVHGAWIEPLTAVATRHFSVGVDIFFGLSGFLICSRLLLEREETGDVNLKQFYVRRIFRIQPPALVVLAVTGLLAVTGIIELPWTSWLAAIFLVQNYVGGVGYVNHFWSLSVEEHFYLTWPWIFRRLSIRNAALVAAGVALLVAAWRVVSTRLGFSSNPNYWAHTDIRIDGLLWGCFVAVVYSSEKGYQLLQRLLTPAASYVLLALFVGLCVLSHSGGYKLSLVAFTLRAFVIPVMLCCTVMNARSLLGRLLELRPARFIGKLSYSLYLWQQLFLVRESLRSPKLGVLQGWPIGVLCALACAWLSYRLIEQPAVRFGHAVARRMTPVSATVSTGLARTG